MRRGLPPMPKRAEDGTRKCRGCDVMMRPPLRVWCSKECRDRGYMALSGWARSAVLRRDSGICARCGADAAKAERIFYALARRFGDNWFNRKPRDYDATKAASLLCAAWGIYKPDYSWTRRSFWEADHVVPLAEGGTNDLSNYRTLCVPCHKDETKALAGRLAKARRCFAGDLTTAAVVATEMSEPARPTDPNNGG